jgi:hypothetical protein
MKLSLRLVLATFLSLFSTVAAHAAAQLAVTAVSTSALAAPGETITFTITIANQTPVPPGGQAVQEFGGGALDVTLRLISPTNSPINLGVSRVAIPPAGITSGGGTVTVTTNRTIPLSYSEAGGYSINCTIDFSPTSATRATASLSGSVNEIVLSSFGSGYATVPTVSITGGGGTGAAGTAVVAAGAVVAIHITNPGTGYTSDPEVALTGGGGSGATAVARISGAINTITFVGGGTGYASAPTVVFTGGGGGTGATGSFAVTGRVTAVAVGSSGANYTSAPAVSITGGGGVGAAATANLSATSVVTAVTVGGAGAGYSTAPTVAFSGGGGSGAAATASLIGGVGSIAVTAGGTGYSLTPVVSITGTGSGATATATVVGGVITRILIDTGANGSGYTVAPTVTIADPTGTGATATAVLNAQVSGITVTSAGSGYTSAPTVSFSGGGGAGATATAEVSRTVASISVTSAGSGYTSAPSVSINGGGGSGATATASLSVSGATPVVRSPGFGYSTAPAVTLAGGGSGGVHSISVGTLTTTGGISITGKPDLRITSLSYPASVAYRGGEVVPMSLTYTNKLATNAVTNVPFVSRGSVTYFRISVRLSPNPQFGDADDFQLTFHDVASTVNADGLSHVISWNQLMPGNFSGSYYVLAKIDAMDVVDEAVEGDLLENGNNIYFDTNATRIALLPTTFPTLTLASTTGAVTANGYSDNPSLSADGRYTAFASDASNLVTGDVNGTRDIFIFDSQNNTVRRLNVSQQGAPANAPSNNPALSADGRFLAFSSDATNLILGDTNAFSDIFVVDTITGAIARQSVSTAGGQSNGSSFRPAMSGDGRYLVFESSATNLIAGTTAAGVSHIYVRDRTLGTTTLVSQSSAGTAGNGASLQASISGDGRYVAFESDANNLVDGDTNALRDIFLRDLTTGTTTRVSVGPGGVQSIGNAAGGASRAPSITTDGRYIAFGSEATNLVVGDTNNVSDVFVYDRVSATTSRLSVASSGGQGIDPSTAPFNIGSFNPNISSTGRYVTFASITDNITPGDESGQYGTLAAATIGGGGVTAVTVTNPGGGTAFSNGITATYYSTVPNVALLGGGGTGARAVANLGFPVASIAVTAGGAGYVNPTVIISGGGAGATASATVLGGVITGITLNTAGVGFGSAPIVTIIDSAGSGAAATATLSTTPCTAGFITGFTITNPGTGYTSAPTVVVAGSFNSALNIYVMDRDVNNTGTLDTAGNLATSMVSVNKFGYQTVRILGQQSTAASDIYPVISADGRWVALPSDAENNSGLSVTTTNLLNNDSNNARDVFLHDRRINTLPNPSAAPSVTITSPGTSTAILVNTPVPITASATTTVGVVSTVQFFVNGTSLGTSAIFPYTQTWTPTAVGTYVLSALVTDSFGNLGVSSNVSVTVNAAPSVGLTSPVAGTNITVGAAQTVTATAAATTPGATITSVQFLANGVSLGSDATAPYSAPWTPTSAGTYSLTAIATDSLGTNATSPAVSVTVNAPSGGGGGGLIAPVVSISTPADGSSIAVNTPQTINATASLTNGTVTGVAFSANGVAIGSATSFPYTVQWTPATAGTFTLTAVATGSNGAQATIANTITVVSAGAPTVSLTSPLGGSVLPVNSATSLFATAADADGTIRNVQFFANGVSVGTATAFPYNAVFTPNSPGIYVIVAVATDNVGNRTTSAAISVTVSGGSGPSVGITAPAAGSSVGVNLPQVITASAASTGGFITGVQFLVNGVTLSTDTSFPYIGAWTPTALGTYTLSALATDNSGNVTTSAPVSIIVAASAAPTVNLTNPVSGSGYTVGSGISITANAADSDGTISQVAFFVNGSILSTDTTSPYASPNWTPGSTGVYTITAQATDNTGNVTTSLPVTVTIGANAAPTVALSSPTSGLNLSLGNNVLIAAAANDSDGSVASVQFFANGISIGSVSTAPYSLSWKPASAGVFSLTAVATDNAGNSTTSAAASVTVTGASAPIVSISNPVTGATFGVGTSVPINAITTGGNGPISQVQFFVNGVSLAVDSAAPYNTIWSPNSAGTYSLVAVSTDNAGVSGTSTAVTVTILPNGAPSVTLVSPGTNLVVGLGTVVNLSATASDSDGTIANVRFLANGTLLATSATLPYRTNFTPTAAGVYTIVAQATDNAGNIADSVAQTITVLGGNVQIVTLNNPSADTSITADSSLLLSAGAAISSGTITRVEFYAGTTLLATKTTAPYTFVWRPAAIGSYAVRAVAFDGNGSGVSSSVSNVTVGPPLRTPGTYFVNLVNPANGSSVVAFRNITFIAGTNVPDSAEPQVDFYANGGIFETVTALPYQTTRNPTVPGSFEFYAVIRVSGAVYTSAPVTVTVLPNTPPVVALTSPSSGSTVNVGSIVTIKAAASDAEDLIDTVKFLVNGQVVSTSSAFPYSASWTPTSEGIYTITAIAKDSQGSVGGNQTSSEAVYVRVTAPAASGGSGVVPDSVYAGSFQSIGETGKYAVITLAGKTATFIGYTTAGGVKTLFYPSLSLDATGGFSSGSALSARVNSTGVSGSLDANRLPFIGQVAFAGATRVASGLFTGNLANRNASTVAAIVGPDGSIMVYVADGAFSDAGAGAVDTAGNFNLSLAGGSRLVGKADPVTGFLNATLTGGPGGLVIGALASGGSFSDGTLRSLSTRGQVGTGANFLIAGFVVGGSAQKQVMVRAIAPTLGTVFGLSGALADSQLEIFNSSGSRIITNDNWATSTNASAIVSAAATVGAFPLTSGSLDSVILTTLAPGAYTAQVSGVGGSTGVALVELYDVDSVGPFSPQKVTSVSTRGVVGTGENNLIAGFQVSGSTSKLVLVRGIGPALSALNVAGALADPLLQIIRMDRGTRTVVRENDNWETGNDVTLVTDASSKVGVFPLRSGSRDAVILISLPPGTYSATVSGVGNTTGVGLVEVYEVP